MMHRTAVALTALLFACTLPAASRDQSDQTRADETLAQRDARLVDAEVGALTPQQPGRIDLYVVGFAGDGSEDVFRNEVEYLDTLMTQRFDAKDRVVTLINHVDSFRKQRPLATLTNLTRALVGVGKTMDRDEDVLLLFLTSHGTHDHRLYLELPPLFEATITPRQLRTALDASDIRNRVVVVSACFSGGFVPVLRSPTTLVMTAASKNRPSFGCGSDSAATYFGRAWLVEGLNQTTDFVAAFDAAKVRIAAEEKVEHFLPSQPQINVGADILPRLQRWRTEFTPGAAVPYPYAEKPAVSATIP
ncbi:MAG: C13 family peptidase [Luteimonas sp.]